jgi:hypothetical protein
MFEWMEAPMSANRFRDGGPGGTTSVSSHDFRCRGGCPQPQSNVTLHPLFAREQPSLRYGSPRDTRRYTFFGETIFVSSINLGTGQSPSLHTNHRSFPRASCDAGSAKTTSCTSSPRRDSASAAGIFSRLTSTTSITCWPKCRLPSRT